MYFKEIETLRGWDNFDSLYPALAARKRDFLSAPLSQMAVDEETGHLRLGSDAYPMSRTAIDSLSKLLRIPTNYMVKSPNEIAAQNLNFFLPSATGNVNVIFEEVGSDQVVMGVMKEKMQPIALDLAVEELAANSQELTLKDWRLDSEGFSARYISEQFEVQPRLGDAVYSGVDFTDYENDDRGLDVSGIIYRLVCLNGAVVPEAAYGRYIKKENWKEPATVMAAALGYFRDCVVNVSAHTSNLATLTERSFSIPTDKPEKFIGGAMRLLRVPVKYHTNVIDAMVPEEETFYGVYNALTALGREAASRDVKFMFERAGFRMLSMIDQVQEAYNLALEDAS